MRVSRVPLASLSLVVAGCALFGPPPRLEPRLAGCYSVHAPGYGDAHAAITGFRSLPSRLSLDTAYNGRVRVPRSWRMADSPQGNVASLALESLPGVARGEYVFFDRYDRPRRLGGDSIIITFRGWSGLMSVYFARTADGFSGFASFAPVMRPEDAPSLRVTLLAAACVGDLV